MIRIRKVSVIAAAALCAVATASPSAARQVTYFATGAFSTPALRGEDQAGVAGSVFIISFVIEGRHSGSACRRDGRV